MKRPYLSNAHLLEHANLTWTAQDMRKSNVFYAAYRYSTETDREKYRERALYFRDYVVEQMEADSTLGFARVQILLMQNHGPHQLIDNPQPPYPVPELPDCPAVSSHYSVLSLVQCTGRRFYTAARNFRLNKEISWIKTRVL